DVSSRHAAIVRHDTTFRVRDLGSKNGTFVNGARVVDEVILHDGDVIGFGPQGPAVEFRVLAVAAGVGGGGTDAHAVSAGVSPAAAGRRASAAVRIAAEVARLRRTTRVLIGLIALSATGFGWSQWTSLREAHDRAAPPCRA